MTLPTFITCLRDTTEALVAMDVILAEYLLIAGAGAFTGAGVTLYAVMLYRYWQRLRRPGA